MNIAVFGASGNCGAHFVRHAAARGHQVTAVTRGDAQLPRGVQSRKGDPLDAGFVADTVAGHEVVFSGLGMRYKHPWAKRESPDDFYSRFTRNIVDAMVHHGVRRLSYISAAGIGDSRAGINWVMRVMFRVSNIGVAYADLERAEPIVMASGLDYQLVRPVTLTHKPATGRVKIVARFT